MREFSTTNHGMSPIFKAANDVCDLLLICNLPRFARTVAALLAAYILPFFKLGRATAAVPLGQGIRDALLAVQRSDTLTEDDIKEVMDPVPSTAGASPLLMFPTTLPLTVCPSRPLRLGYRGERERRQLFGVDRPGMRGPRRGSVFPRYLPPCHSGGHGRGTGIRAQGAGARSASYPHLPLRHRSRSLWSARPDLPQAGC